MTLCRHDCERSGNKKAPPDVWKIIFRIGGAFYLLFRFLRDLI